MSKRVLTLAALLGVAAAACADLPEAEVSFGDGVRFVPMVADATDDVGLGNDVAVDADGNPYVSYFGFPEEQGELATTRPVNSPFLPAVQLTAFTEGIFVRGAVAEPVDPPGGYVVPFGPETLASLEQLTAENASGTAIAISPEGERHVVWSGDQGVWYGLGAADGGFTVDPIEATDRAGAQGGTLGRPSITLDEAGTPWVAYQADTGSDVEVRVATPDADRWNVQVVGTTALCDGCTTPGAATVVMLAGAPVVVWADPTSGQIVQARLDGARWQTSTAVPNVDAVGLAGTSTDSGAFLSYYGDGAISVASASGSSWTPTEVAGADVVDVDDLTSDVAVDDRGQVYVAWQDSQGVHVASGDGETFQPIGTEDTAGGVSPSVAVTADGAAVYLSWYDPESQDLMLGRYGEVGELQLANPSPVPPPSVGAPTDEECGADGTPILDIVAVNIQFDPTCLVAPAGEPFTINFDNQDAGTPHDIAIVEGEEQLFNGDDVTGPDQVVYDVDPLDAGSYEFLCTIHPETMTGVLAAVGGNGGAGNGAGDGGGGGGAADGGAQGETSSTNAADTASPTA